MKNRIKFIAYWNGQTVEGSIPRLPSQSEIDGCHLIGWHEELVSIVVEDETMTFDGEFVVRCHTTGEMNHSPTQLSAFVFGRVLIEAQAVYNRGLVY